MVYWLKFEAAGDVTYKDNSLFSWNISNQIFVKGYDFLSFAKNMDKDISKNISKNLSSKYSQKLLDHAKQSATDAPKTASKRAI